MPRCALTPALRVQGYDVAKTFGAHFSHIAPVWFLVRMSDKGEVTVVGDHDVDRGWVADVRRNAPGIKVVPRFSLDGFGGQQLGALFSSVESLRGFAKLLARETLVGKYGDLFDGLVLEIGIFDMGQIREPLVFLLAELANELRLAGKEFFFVIPPQHQGSPVLFDGDLFRAALPYVDGFSLMTYDYSNAMRPGPNAPVAWIRDCVATLGPKSVEEARKILVGLNFYANDFAIEPRGPHSPLLGRDVLDRLRSHSVAMLDWDGETAEHSFTYTSADGVRHLVHVPTPASIAARVALARRMGASISVWEIGQGLDGYFRAL